MKHDPTKFAYASPRGTAEDVAWHVAKGIQIGPGGFDNDETAGLIVARPHATGWFISAYHRPGLPADQMDRLRESVTVHAFALLQRGPSTELWTRSKTGDGWYADISATVVRDVEPLTELSVEQWGVAARS